MTLKSMKSVAIAAAAAVGLSLAASAGVAKIGEKEYDTLDEALDTATSGQKVEVTADCALANPFTNTNRELVVDFGGHTVTYAGNEYAFTVSGGQSSLTITNGTFNGTGTTSYFFLSNGGSKFTLAGVTADQVCDANAILKTSDCSVGRIVDSQIGGTYERTRYAVSITGTKASKAYDGVTIENSTIRTTGTVDVPETWNYNSFYMNAAMLVGAAKVRITGENTSICGAVHAIYASSYGGELQIDGGNYTARQDFFSVLAFDHPSHGSGWGSLNVAITGGEFVGRVYVHGHTGSTLNIAGGEFTNFEGWQGSGSDKPAQLTVTDGRFDSDPNIFKGVANSGLNSTVMKEGDLILRPALDLVATAANKIGRESDGQWEIVDAAPVSAVAGAKSTLTKLVVDGETIYDEEIPVVVTNFPYSVRGMVVEGFKPVKMKVEVDIRVEATYTADEGYHFGKWEGEDSETTQTKSGTAELDEILDISGDAALPPPSADDVTWIGAEGAKWGDFSSWQDDLVPSPTATVNFAASAVVDLNQDAKVNDIVMADGSELKFMTTGDTKRTLTVDGQRYDGYYFYGNYGTTISYVGSNVAAEVSTTCASGISAHGTYRAADGAKVTMTALNASDNTMAFVAEGAESELNLSGLIVPSGDANVTVTARDFGEVVMSSKSNAAWGNGTITCRVDGRGYIFAGFVIGAGTKPVFVAENDSTIQIGGITAHAADGSIDLRTGGELCLNGNLKIGSDNALTLTSDGTGAIAVDEDSKSATITIGSKATVNLTARPDVTNALFRTYGKAISVSAGATFNIDTAAFGSEAGDSWEILLADQGTYTTWTNFKDPVLNASGNYDLSIKKEGAKAYLVIARPQPPVTYDWIRSNGKGYIETGWKLGFDAVYTLDGQTVGVPTGSHAIFATAGNEDVSKKLFMMFFYSYENPTTTSFYYAPHDTSAEVDFVEYSAKEAITGGADEKFSVRVEGNKATVNGTELTSDKTVSPVIGVTTGNLCFFVDVGNHDTSWFGDYKLYGMKIYDATGAKLVCEFIPAKQGDSVGLIERQYGEDGVTVVQESFRTPSATGFEVGNDEPAGPTVNGDATIAPAGEGAWAVTPNGEATITVTGLNAGDKVTIPVDTVESVTGVPASDLILTVNGVEVDNQYFVGMLDGSATFSTELGEAAKPVIGEEGVEAPFVVGDTVEVKIKPIDGLYYQLIRGTEVTEIGEMVDEKTLEGVVLTITLTDDDKPSAGAFYKVGVTKGPQMTDK